MPSRHIPLPRLRAALPILCLCSFLAPVRAQQAQPPVPGQQPIEAGLGEETPAELIVWNRVLAVFRTTFDGATPDERAQAAKARIEGALGRLTPEMIRTFIMQDGSDRGAVIFGGSVTLFAIHERDLPQEAAATLEEAGPIAVERLQTLIRERAVQYRWPNVVRGVILSLLATLGFAVVWLGIQRVRYRLVALVTTVAASRMSKAELAGIDPRPFVYGAFAMATKLGALAALAAVAYLWLAFLLAQFAYSRPWSQRLGGMLLDGLSRTASAVVDELPNFVMIAIIFFVTRAVQSAIGTWFRSVERGDIPLQWMDPLSARSGRRLVSVGIWLFAITVAYPYVPGAETDAFKGVSVFVGLMLSLGSAGIVGQLMSGFFLVFNRGLRPGEFVQIGDVQGVVKDLGLMSVRIASPGHKEVTMPNSVVIGAPITNMSRHYPGTVVLNAKVTIGYDAPWRQVRAMLLNAASRTDGVVSDPAPFVLETALSDFYVEYELVAHGVTTVPRVDLMAHLHEHILDEFNEHGVQIMSPHFQVQPNKEVLVPRSRWHADPAQKDS